MTHQNDFHRKNSKNKIETRPFFMQRTVLASLCAMETFCACWMAGMFCLLMVTGFGRADSVKVDAGQRPIITLPLSKVAPSMDGKIDLKEYGDAVVLGGDFLGCHFGGGVTPVPNSPTVYLKRVADRFYVLYDNPLGEGERPSMQGAVPDNSGICMGNAIELFFLPHLPDGELLKWFQFIGNARGCIYDAMTTPEVGVTYVAEYNVPWEFVNSIVPGHWYGEISVKFASLMIRSTTDGESFDFDCCRDGGGGPARLHSYVKAFGRVGEGKGVKMIFDATAPAVQWLDFGRFERNQFNPKLRLVSCGRGGKYTMSLLLTEPKSQPDGSYKELWSYEQTLDLPVDGAKEVTVNHELPKDSKGIAHYRITGPDGKVLFYRELAYTTNNPALSLYDKSKAKPLVCEARMAPSYGRIGVSADIIDYDGDRDNVVVEVTGARVGSDQIPAKILLDKFRLNYAEGILEMGDDLPAGEYEVNFRMLDRKTGKPLGPVETVKLTRKIYPWENNRLGYSDKPVAPWTPMSLDKGIVHCWGREYSFDSLGLPAKIMTLQPEPTRGPAVADVLAGPVRLVGESDGKEIAWTDASSRVTDCSATEAHVVGKAVGDGLTVSVNGTLEYDGFYKIHMKIDPGDKPVELDSLRVEVPMPTEHTRLFHSVGESMRTNKTFADFEGLPDGVLWNSKTAAKNAIIKGNFLPVAWLGDEDRGIGWMCENDRTWVLDFDKPCLDVVRKGNETSFRMHLVNEPVKLDRPIEVTFSLQATPVRPRQAGESWKTVEWYGWSQFDMPLMWDKCLEPYKQGKGYKWYRTPEAKKQDRWWRYGCLASDRISPEDPSYGQMIKDFGAEWYCDSIWMKSHNKAHQDFELWAYKQWHDIGGMDGVYFDNTFPAPSTNLLNNTAYIDDKGCLRPGYVVMTYREQLKRLRNMFVSMGPAPVLMTHITDTPVPGYLGFADFWLDGENGGYPPSDIKNPDFVDRWYNKIGMANLRMTLGRMWGIMPMYLYSWGLDSTQAVLGLFDMDNRLVRADKVDWDFGNAEADCLFIPYWSTSQPVNVTAGGPDVLLSVWKRPGRARIHVANCSNENRRVTLAIDRKALGLPDELAAWDEQTGELLALDGDKLSDLPVNRHGYRRIVLAAPGSFPTLPTLDASLMPAKRIENLCDDFNKPTLDPAWTVAVSPTILVGDHYPDPVVSVDHGTLRLFGSLGSFVVLRRPFNQDNCSVQVQIRTALDKPYGTYPSLSLYWDKEHYVQVGVDTRTAGGRFIVKVAGNAKPLKNAKDMTMPTGPVNWVKITLTPEQIEFYGTTDGKSWKLLATVAREGFNGAPSWLILGQDMGGPNEFLQNQRPDTGFRRSNGCSMLSYFDDLITGRP